jgi:hypothetical protein
MAKVDQQGKEAKGKRTRVKLFHVRK